jgi:hypothetical protein
MSLATASGRTQHAHVITRRTVLVINGLLWGLAPAEAPMAADDTSE